MPARPRTSLAAITSVVAIALPSTARATDYRFALDADIAARSVGVTVPSGSGLFASDSRTAANVLGAARLRIFLDPVTDDDAPPLLQAFLQRRSQIWVRAGLGYESYSQPLIPYDILGSGLGAGADLYLTSRVALWLRAGFNRSAFTGSSKLAYDAHRTNLEVAGGLALRIDDVRFGAGYVRVDTWESPDGSPPSDDHQSPGWGRFQLDLEAAIRRAVALQLTAQIWDGGAGIGVGGNGVGGGVDGRAEWFVTRNTGLSLAVGGGGGVTPLTLFDPVHESGLWRRRALANQFRWGVGVSHFFGSQVALLLGYFGQYEWSPSNVAYADGPTATSHGGRVTVFARF